MNRIEIGHNPGGVCPERVSMASLTTLVCDETLVPVDEMICVKDCPISAACLGGAALPLTARVECQLRQEASELNPDQARKQY